MGNDESLLNLKDGELIDNRRELSLLKVLDALTKDSSIFKCAVGYFYLEGLVLFIDSIKEYNRIKILIGEETTKFTKVHLVNIFKRNFNKLEKNKSTIEKVKLFYNLVQSEKKLEIKVYLQDKNKIGRLHSKLYLFLNSEEGDKRYKSAIVGSSNLTPDGLIKNTELNVVIKKKETLINLEIWFEELWEKGSYDFDKLKIKESILLGIEASHFGKEIDLEYQYINPMIFFTLLIRVLKADYLFEDWEDTNLFKFQQIDALRCLRLFNEKNLRGVFLTSSVGLGKSYVACHIAKYYSRQSKKVLLVAPAGLITDQDHWPRYLAEFNLNSNEVEVKSMGLLQKKIEEFNEDEYIKNYNLIIVDEAHNYRNVDANRTKNLKRIIDLNANAKILFLTATPINTRLRDLVNLINLFHRRGVNDYFSKLISDLSNIVDKIEEVAYEDLTDNEKELISKIQEEIERELIVKSTRETIKTTESFVDELEVFTGVRITEIQDPIVNEVIYQLADEYRTIVDGILEFLLSLKAAHLRIIDPSRGRRLGGFFKWILYKRFESDVSSYYLTLRRLLKRNTLILKAIEMKDVTIIEDDEFESEYLNDEIVIAFKSDYRYRLEEVIAKIDKGEGEEHLEVVKDLQLDVANIKQELEKLEKHRMEKTQTLFKQDKKIEQLHKIFNENEQKKILVFTEYKDTLYALQEYLKDKIDLKTISFIYSGVKNKPQIVTQFNNAESVLRILITTDTLSEGYNISGADIVINFDIPYNPVKIIQRIGRATRVDLPKQIQVLNFRPDENIDKEIQLVNTLKYRIQDIIRWVGIEYRIWFEKEKELLKVRRKKDRTLYIDVLREIRNDQISGKLDKLEVTIQYTKPILAILQRAIQTYKILPSSLETVDKYLEPIVSSTVTEKRKNYYTTLLGDEKLLIGFYNDGLSYNEEKIQNFEIDDFSYMLNFPIVFQSEIKEFEEYVKKEQNKMIMASFYTDRLDRDIHSIKDKINRGNLDELYPTLLELIETIDTIYDLCGSTTEQVIRRILRSLRRDEITNAKITDWINSIKNSFTKRIIQSTLIEDKLTKPNLFLCYLKDRDDSGLYDTEERKLTYDEFTSLLRGSIKEEIEFDPKEIDEIWDEEL